MLIGLYASYLLQEAQKRDVLIAPALENGYDLEYRKGFYLGVAMTGFKHPECGGEFIPRGSDISLNMRFSERLYSP
ncbi:MAG: hypothetical protein ACJA0H_000619 [Francisellaceae bacterium]|jgi:hypothetical protein